MYDAFISYAHESDSRFAKALKRALERLSVPWYRPKALRLFLDEEGLASSPALWPSIERALDDSSWLIHVASPRAAQSKWVTRELEHFVRRKGTDRVLLVLVDGEIVWDEAKGDFDVTASSALASVWSGLYDVEPLWTDFRTLAHDRWTRRDADFVQRLAAIAAPIQERSPDELVSVDARHHRGALRAAWVTAGILLLLLGATVWFGTSAYAAKEREIDALELALDRYEMAYEALEAVAQQIKDLQDVPGTALRASREEMVRRLSEDYERLVAASEASDPEDDLAIRSKITAGDLAEDLGRVRNARRFFQDAWSIAQRRLERGERSRPLLSQAVRVTNRLSKLATGLTEQEELSRTSLRLAETLWDTHPKDAEAHYLLGAVHAMHGETFRLVGRVDQALRQYEDALQVLRVVEGSPRWEREARLKSHEILVRQAEIASDRRDFGRVESLCAELRVIGESTIQADPTRISSRLARVETIATEADLLWHLGQHATAVDAVETGLEEIASALREDAACLPFLLAEQELLLLRVRIGSQVDDPETALELLRRAIESLGRAGEAHEHQTHELRRNTAAALQIRAVRNLVTGDVQAAFNDQSHAGELVEALLQERPRDVDLLGLAASVCAVGCDVARYRAAYEEALASARDMRRRVEQILSVTGPVEEHLERLCDAVQREARTLHELGRSADARECLESALALAESSSSNKASSLASLWARTTLALDLSRVTSVTAPDRSREAAESALSWARQIHELDPKLHVGLELLAGSLSNLAEIFCGTDPDRATPLWEEAAEKLRTLLQVQDVPQVRRNLIELLRVWSACTPDSQLADSLLQQARQLSEELPAALDLRTRVEDIRSRLESEVLSLLEQGSFERAEQLLESLHGEIQALEEERGELRMIEELRVLHCELEGQVAYQLGRLEEAEVWWRRAVALRLALAEGYERVSMAKDALASARSQLAPILILRGELSEASQHIEGAVQYFEKALSESPDPLTQTRVFLVLSMASDSFWAVDERERSRECAKRALELAGDLAAPHRAVLESQLSDLEERLR